MRWRLKIEDMEQEIMKLQMDCARNANRINQLQQQVDYMPYVGSKVLVTEWAKSQKDDSFLRRPGVPYVGELVSVKDGLRVSVFDSHTIRAKTIQTDFAELTESLCSKF